MTWRGDEMQPTSKQSSLLPVDIRDELVKASKLRDPRERQAAVQEATERAQRRYPQFFSQPPVKEYSK